MANPSHSHAPALHDDTMGNVTDAVWKLSLLAVELDTCISTCPAEQNIPLIVEWCMVASCEAGMTAGGHQLIRDAESAANLKNS